jgi:diacylglycerol kinase family enzyme
MYKMLHLFVINPKSFGDRKKIDEFIISARRQIEGSTTFFVSRFPRDAVMKVNNFLKAATEKGETVRVYAVGGDGILFDCLNGMMKYRNHELTSVPYGNANDFLRAFGNENVQAFRDVKALSKAGTVKTDIFRFGENVGMANGAIGLECSSIIETEKMAKKLSKLPFARKLIPLLYTLGAVVIILNSKLRTQYYNITLDGVDYSGEYVDINVGNCYANGGKNSPNPYAMPNDGWLDAVFVKKMSALKCLLVIGDYINGHFEKHPKLFFHVRFKELHATSDQPLRVCTDGESFYTSDYTMTVYPSALNFVAPEGMMYKPYKEYRGDKQ